MSDCKHNVTVSDCTGFTICVNVDCRKVLAPSTRENIWDMKAGVFHVTLDDGTPETGSDKR